MKYAKDYLIGNVSKSLIAAALCLQMPLAVRAQDAGPLQPETASMDVTTALQNPPQDATAAASAGDLQSENADAHVFKLAAQKLSTGVALSADEYRALGVGCTGMEADKPFFQDIAKVTVVYPGSPADKAGIRRGDEIINNEKDNAQAVANPEIPQWQVKLGKAGTPIDLTFLRHGQPVTITLVRMNIEDIQDAKYRERWEKIVRDLGYQTEGTFNGTGHHPDYSRDGR